ncbi:glycoside hydrolase family 2 TIM barrel-domain containing protein [Agaribacterium haliotis]|uniref:glycoside hydrolase family 2 TIM barrel-domain containing protein n=1 Tax=Agaribacterium haliotis TaxID=2013869 RepID=UPI000BB56954|nr:glycoside hydrolase family 2 TIM barrel-domain containing protein [Agaribacterium haliotis]
MKFRHLLFKPCLDKHHLAKPQRLILAITIAASVALGACAKKPEAPVEQVSAERNVDFNFNWQFSLDDSAEFSKVDFDSSHWRTLRLPHDWSIEADFDKELDGATAYLPGGIGWYRKSFVLDKNKISYLYFDGIYNNSEIWLNGEKIGGRINGYTPFYYEISQYLKPAGQTNVLAIRVDRSRYIDSRWYPGSGIYRDVQLIQTDLMHIPPWGTYVKTPTATSELGELEIDVSIANKYPQSHKIELKTSVLDAEGNTVASTSTEATLSSRSANTLRQHIQVSQPSLWSPDNPALYTARTEIYAQKKLIDSYDTRFGFRHIRYDANEGFFLNGVNTPIKGVNLHHDAGALGAAVPDDVWRRRLEKLKRAGTNALRMAHNPSSVNLLRLADEMGFLVQSEIFDEWDNPKDKRLNQWERHDDYISRGYADWFQQEAESDLKLAVKRDRNHPSVVMWSIGNEIEWTYPRYKEATGYFDMNASGNYFYNPPFISPEEIRKRFFDSPEGPYVLANTAKKLSKWVKEVDNTRPVTANLILPSVSHLSGYTDALDIIGYSYRRVIYDYGHKLYPGKMIMGTENVPQWHEWKAVEDRDFIPGTFLWTGIDYLGESHNAWPRKAVTSGLLDTAGFDNPSFHMFKSLWNDEPHIYISSQTEEKSLYREQDGSVVEKEPGKWAERVWIWQDVNRHWNYQDGEKVIVEVLSNCEAVELFLNERSLGVQKLADNDDRELKWALDYEAGTLRAKGLGDCASEDKIRTAGSATDVELSSDKSSLAFDNYEVAHIVAQLKDADGNKVSHQELPLKLSLSDNLELLGADNGDTTTMQRYQSPELSSDQGQALFVIRRTAAGPASVKVTAGKLKAAKLTLN